MDGDQQQHLQEVDVEEDGDTVMSCLEDEETEACPVTEVDEDYEEDADSSSTGTESGVDEEGYSLVELKAYQGEEDTDMVDLEEDDEYEEDDEEEDDYEDEE